MEPTTTPEAPMTPAAKPANGPVVALLIILLLIVAGASYVWMNQAQAPTLEEDAASLETQSESTEPAVIESDLNAESPDEFSEDFDAAFTELDAAFEAQ
ncbi:hypothetical protein K2Y00_02635 [Patescibacteria group bacterium]|nr:hypothetical protein [Patescibacteria group bacterium]